MSNPFVLAKQSVVCDKTTRCSRNLKGHFSDYVPRNFENVRRNFISDGQNLGNIRENQEKGDKCRERFENSSQIWRRIGFEPTEKTLVFS